jgi:nucleoside-diphosphate-sugar epimerase
MGNDALTRDLAVLGGTGFLGRHFVAAASRQGRRVRMLVRDPAAAPGVAIGGGLDGAVGGAIESVRGDLGDAEALTRLITPGATVVNFAWSGKTAPADAVRQARQLAAACREAQAYALLHCSTAAVFGACGDYSVITDDTAPRPADAYGRVKLAVDNILRQELEGRVPLALLRPASVFGTGGEGLVKLIAEIASGGGLASYLRSCLFDRRFLHLVPVETVVEAFLFVEPRVGPSGNRHLITADDEPLNQYRAMERRLMQLFDVPDHRWPRVPMPPAALRLALRAGQRVASLPFTPFDAGGLRALGFRPPVAFDAAVESFAAWYRARAGVAPHRRATGAVS